MYILLVQELCPADFEHSTHKVGECCSVFSVAGEKNVLSVEDMHIAQCTQYEYNPSVPRIPSQYSIQINIFNFFGLQLFWCVRTWPYRSKVWTSSIIKPLLFQGLIHQKRLTSGHKIVNLSAERGSCCKLYKPVLHGDDKQLTNHRSKWTADQESVKTRCGR